MTPEERQAKLEELIRDDSVAILSTITSTIAYVETKICTVRN